MFESQCEGRVIRKEEERKRRKESTSPLHSSPPFFLPSISSNLMWVVDDHFCLFVKRGGRRGKGGRLGGEGRRKEI